MTPQDDNSRTVPFADPLEELVTEAARLAHADTGDRLLGAAALGDELEHRLTNSEALLEISRRVVSIAERLECESLYGASLVGERLSAAAVADRSNGLHLYSRSGPRLDAQRVLIVDGIVATGASISQSVREIESRGSNPVAAAVVLDARGERQAQLETDVVSLRR